ncbi:hypothetical protein [Methanosarcina sp. 1.H.A.2.2]|uniref:hypothetical protein n=1 Tax=Methanosarcina sp. 1.H.A.2.2 TaxID=1483601 RepID=UPI000621ED63|nr:hypothetical protein [Methanosarcina sp. 1.H.A.2.2]KKH50168.1 hypothetical protein EO93_04420 [Methanosarcina sp. 1.H.A.2.2]
MKGNIKNIDPSGPIEDVIYKLLLLYKQPLHYKKIKELLIEAGYYELNGRKAPRDYTGIFRSLRLDGRFIRLERGYYGLKEVNLGLYLSTELNIDCEDSEDITSQDPEIEVKMNSETENTREIVELENESMNAEEIINPEIFAQVGILDVIKENYSTEEIKEMIERARKEYYGHFLPQFIASEMNIIMEKNKV